MAAIRAKLIAATVVVAGGLSAVLFPLATAQQPGPGGGPFPGAGGPPGGGGPPGFPGAPPGGGGPPALPGGGPPRTDSGVGPPAAMSARAPWEYTFVAGGLDKDFVAFFTQMGNDGWEYSGSFEATKEQLANAMKAHPDRVANKGGSNTTLIFKRLKNAPPRGFGGGTGFGMPGGGGGGLGGPGFGPGGGAFGGGTGAASSATFASPGGGGSPPPGSGGFTAPGGPPMGFPAPGRNPLGAPAGAGAGGGAGLPVLPEDSKQPLTVLALRNSSSSEMADLLQKLFKNATIVAEPRSNTLLIRAEEQVEKEIQELIRKLDVESVKPPKGKP